MGFTQREQENVSVFVCLSVSKSILLIFMQHAATIATNISKVRVFRCKNSFFCFSFACDRAFVCMCVFFFLLVELNGITASDVTHVELCRIISVQVCGFVFLEFVFLIHTTNRCTVAFWLYVRYALRVFC